LLSQSRRWPEAPGGRGALELFRTLTSISTSIGSLFLTAKADLHMRGKQNPAGAGFCVLGKGRFWPRVCENSDSKIQSGKSMPVRESSTKFVAIMGLIERKIS